MIKPSDPRNLAIDLLPRSTCSVQVASVITDAGDNIISWGWNSSGPTGYGLCAERYAIVRANRNRLWCGTIYIAGKWRNKETIVKAKPCLKCQQVINKYELDVIYRDRNGEWR